VHRVIYVPRWALLGNNGAGWLPNVSLVADDLEELYDKSFLEEVKRHETIHQVQQNELGYPKWVLVYLWLLWKHGYQEHPMEIDANVHKRSEKILASRNRFYWRVL